MADLNLDIIVTPTYSIYNMAVVDISTYTTDPPSVTNPTLEITVPGGYDTVSKTFTVEETNVLDSTDLGLTTEGNELPLPDGIYRLKYMVDPSTTNYVEKSIMRVDKLQEKFDKVFMQLDMMECDRVVRKQTRVELNAIFFMIQCSMAAANNCADTQARKLYDQADAMLCNLLIEDCGASSNNYIINFG